MATQTYSLVPSRNLIRAEMDMLAHAETYQVLGGYGMHVQQPLRRTDTVVFRRLNPYNMTANGVANISANSFILAEGGIPTPATISYTDVSVTLQQYAVLFKLTSKSELMYEDDLPADMKRLTGESIGELCEMVDYGEFKAGTTVVYSNGSTRAGINTTISLDNLRQCARTLENNGGRKVTTAIKPGLEFGTAGVSPAWIVFVHTDMVSSVRDLPRFVERINYGSAIKPTHEREFGACEEFRFISSRLLKPFLAAGSASLNGMVAADDTNVDVYPTLIIAEEAWGHVSLKGYGRTSISPTFIPPRQKTPSNPAGTFGYVGADIWYAALRANENFFVRLEAAAKDLTP